MSLLQTPLPPVCPRLRGNINQAGYPHFLADGLQARRKVHFALHKGARAPRRAAEFLGRDCRPFRT